MSWVQQAPVDLLTLGGSRQCYSCPILRVFLFHRMSKKTEIEREGIL